jgi:tripartite-type tricarboxylate transporter receptor subunit TctC
MNLINVASLRAQNDADFKGKTIKIIVGTSAGGGVDLWVRLTAQYIGRHLAGEPALVVQNMRGVQVAQN